MARRAHRVGVPSASRYPLAAEAAELGGEIGRLVAAVAPWLLELPGMVC